MKMVGQTNPNLISNWQDSDFFKTMEQKTGIAFEFYTIPQTAWKEKFNLIFASNDMPDVFYKSDISLQDISSYSQQGYFIDLAPLIPQYAPNIDKLLKENDAFRQAVTMSDGRITALPQIAKREPKTPLWINQQWLDKLGLKAPENMDELYTVLKAFQEKDPNGNGKADEIPLCLGANNGAVSQFNLLMSGFGLYFDDNNTNVFVDQKTNELVFSPETEAYREALLYFKKLYDEKLLDNECFTQKQEQVKAKGTEADARIGSTMIASPVLVVGAKRHYDYSIVPVLRPANGVAGWNEVPYVKSGCFAITNKNKNPEAALRWVDYLYSEEGARLVWMGQENEDYTINADGTWEWKLHESDKGDLKTHRAHVAMQPGGLYAGMVPELWNNTSVKEEQHLIKERAKSSQYLLQPFPTIYYERSRSKELTTLVTDINSYVSQSMAQFISGALDLDKDWDTYLQTLKRMGSDNLKSICAEGYDSLKK